MKRVILGWNVFLEANLVLLIRSLFYQRKTDMIGNMPSKHW